MSLRISTWRDPYDAGFSPTKPKEITLQEGLTVLVGCNGAGKSTLLHNIEEVCKKQEIPVHYYDNLYENRDSISSALFGGDMELGACLWTSSEGECIKINFSQMAKKVNRFLSEGFYDSKANRLAKIFAKENEKNKEISSSSRVLLFDAVDSGLSIDSVIEIKAVFQMMQKEAKELGISLYIVIAANEYELARGENCFDVNEGTYLRFQDYEDYRSFIIKSRAKKEKRIEKQKIWFQKKKEKEERALAKRKEKYEPMIAEIKEKAEKENRKLSWKEDETIYRYERYIKTGRW